MPAYRYVLFDLDHTLWDYDRNTESTLEDLHRNFRPRLNGTPFEEFSGIFFKVNAGLWELYNQQLITKDTIRNDRFSKVLEEIGIEDEGVSAELADAFMTIGPTKKQLMPGARDTLQQLHGKFSMAILTNGFDNSQDSKLRHSGIKHFFHKVVTSETTGFTKPHREIFASVLEGMPFQKEEVIMVGDNHSTDIEGALNFGIDSIFYDPANRRTEHSGTYRITSLTELPGIISS